MTLSIDRISQRLPIINQSSGNKLKDGQIVRGKILKLHPKNMATIQIGSNKLVAKLEASLTLGERYYLQVQNTEDLLHLKIVGHKLNNQSNQNSAELLKQLGLKLTKDNIALTQTLLDDHISFNPDQLKKAFLILEKESYKEQTKSILKHMLAVNLPVTKSVFEALMSQNEKGFTNQIHQLQHLLLQKQNQTPLEQNVSNLIKQLTGTRLSNTNIIENEILLDVSAQQQDFFKALKLIGVIEPDVDFEVWKRDLEPFLTQNPESNPNVLKYTSHDAKSALNTSSGYVIEGFNHLVSNRELFFGLSEKWSQLFSKHINQSILMQSSLPPSIFEQASQFILVEISPLLPKQQQHQLESLLSNNPQSLEKLMRVMRLLHDNQIYHKMTQFKVDNQLVNENRNLPLEQRFLNHIKQFTTMTGLTYENLVLEDNPSQLNNTLKGLLLQIIQQNNEGPISDQSVRLLNSINGLQLQSVSELNNILYAHLQIPAEKIGLVNELELKFEGKKKNGRIDTDHCRIHFYLELSHLKETIIDMNVQNRSVTITVYNDIKALKSIGSPFINLLKENLKSMNYKLSTVSFKPLHSSLDNSLTENLKYETNTQGMDYRI